jgi:hypothetical protein
MKRLEQLQLDVHRETPASATAMQELIGRGGVEFRRRTPKFASGHNNA